MNQWLADALEACARDLERYGQLLGLGYFYAFPTGAIFLVLCGMGGLVGFTSWPTVRAIGWGFGGLLAALVLTGCACLLLRGACLAAARRLAG